jgi:hypothetical protein
MANTKKESKKPAFKNAGKVSVAPDTETIKTKKASKKAAKLPKTTKNMAAPLPTMPNIGNTEGTGSKGKAASAPKQAKMAKEKPAGKSKKKVFKAEPHRAPPTAEKRNFMLLNADHEDIGKFTGKSPRQAALKIANTGVINITIRETGQRRSRNIKGEKVVEYKVHHYTGSRALKHKGENDPEWMPEMVNVPHVEKVGSEWIPIDT